MHDRYARFDILAKVAFEESDDRIPLFGESLLALRMSGIIVWEGSSELDVVVLIDTRPCCAHASTPIISLPELFTFQFLRADSRENTLCAEGSCGIPEAGSSEGPPRARFFGGGSLVEHACSMVRTGRGEMQAGVTFMCAGSEICAFTGLRIEDRRSC